MLSCMFPLAAKELLLVVEATNGSLTRFQLEDKPALTFAASQLTVTVGDNDYRYELDEVARFYFEEGTSDNIAKVGTDNLLVSNDGHGNLTIQNARQVSVFTAAGIRVDGVAALHEHHATVSLGSLPAGIYLISINNQKTIKFTKK